MVFSVGDDLYFSCNNETINEEYEKYLSLYQEWADSGKEVSKLYKKYGP